MGPLQAALIRNCGRAHLTGTVASYVAAEAHKASDGRVLLAISLDAQVLPSRLFE